MLFLNGLFPKIRSLILALYFRKFLSHKMGVQVLKRHAYRDAPMLAVDVNRYDEDVEVESAEETTVC